MPRYFHGTVTTSLASLITILVLLAHLTLPRQSSPGLQNSIIDPPRGYTTAAEPICRGEQHEKHQSQRHCETRLFRAPKGDASGLRCRRQETPSDVPFRRA